MAKFKNKSVTLAVKAESGSYNTVTDKPVINGVTLQGNISLAQLGIYEVGDLYLSMGYFNPATRFGGTWELIAQGKMLVGVDTNDTDFNVVGKTGGEKAHTLTIDEMPSHTHNIRSMADNATSATAYIKSGTNSVETLAPTNATGGGQAHNNLPPYITCYIWERIA